MNRKLILLLWLIPLTSFGGIRFIPWSNDDPDVVAYKATVIANGSTVSATTIAALNTFVKGLKADSVWAKIQFLAPVAGDDLTAARCLLKYPVGIASIMANSGSFVSGDYTETGSTGGLKGNGTSKYLDSGFNPVGQSSSTSSLHLGVYVKGTEAGGTTRFALGNATAGGLDTSLIAWATGGTKERGGVAAADTNGTADGGTTSKEGMLLVATNGSRVQTLYSNGTALGSTATATGAFNNSNIFIASDNLGGTASFFSTRYLRLISIGTGLSATDASNFYTRALAFETALSRN